MKKLSGGIIVILFVSIIFIFSKCNGNNSEVTPKDSTMVATNTFGGFGSQVKWGEHIVSVSGCNDCHTPKKMGPQGPEPDFSLALSGHPSQIPAPDVDRKEMESKGLIVTRDLTAWVGPWGISYTANITSDSTGIGNWKEDQFILCMRQGKYMGIANERSLLPPMPWQEFRLMTDGELKAIFAYLKSTRPIHNIVPQPQPPVLAMKK